MIRTQRGGFYLEFEIIDRGLLMRIRNLLGSTHKVSRRKRKNWQPSYRLQIGSKGMYFDLLRLGIGPRKSKTIQLPRIPSDYFADFLRGYFDGDGNLIAKPYSRVSRPSPIYVFRARFTSGSRVFLEQLQDKILNSVSINGKLMTYGNAWRLSYENTRCQKLMNFMYKSGELADLIYLRRKYRIFQKSKYFAGVA